MMLFYHAHSGLRYLVLLAGLIALALAVYGLARRTQAGGAARIAMSAFSGLLDLQIVLGLVLILMGVWYPALAGHLVMMLLAAAAAHVASARARRADDPQRAHRMRLIGAGLALVLILGGIMAIGRSAFGSGAPSMGG